MSKKDLPPGVEMPPRDPQGPFEAMESIDPYTDGDYEHPKGYCFMIRSDNGGKIHFKTRNQTVDTVTLQPGETLSTWLDTVYQADTDSAESAGWHACW